MASIFVDKINTLEEFRVKSNTVFGATGDLETLTQNASVQFTGLIGENLASFTGTAATFNVTRAAGSYTVEIATAGTGYAVGDTITIYGYLLGGEQPTHDLVITVSEIDTFGVGNIVAVTHVGDATADIISELNAVRNELGSQLTNTLDTTAQTFYGAINEHEADIGTVGDLTTTATNLTDAINELDAFQGNETLTTTANTISGAIVELDNLQGNVSMGTTATTVTGAIKEHEDQIGNVSYGTDATTITGALKEHEDQIGNVDITSIAAANNTITGALTQLHTEVGSLSLTAQGTSTDHPTTVTYVDLGSDLTDAANALKTKVDFLADEVGGEMATDYDGSDNNIITALNNLYAASSISTLNDVYLRRDAQDWVTTGTFRVGEGGIGGGISYDSDTEEYSYHDFIIKGYDSNDTLQDRLTVKYGTGNIGIGGAPSTTKLKVHGTVNATTGYQLNGSSIDNRYLRLSDSAGQTVATNTNFTGTLSYKGENLDARYLKAGTTDTGSMSVSVNVDFDGNVTLSEDVLVGSTYIARTSDADPANNYTVTEWAQDVVGGMFTSNSESGGISATYSDSTGKITLAIADDVHNHIVSNIDGFAEAAQDAAGSLITAGTHSGISTSYDDTNNKLNISNTDKGSSQYIYKTITAQNSAGQSMGSVTADSNSDTLYFRPGLVSSTEGISISTSSDDIVIISHANTSALSGSYGQTLSEDGTYIKSITVDTYGHLTAVTSDDFDNRYSRYAFKTITLDSTDDTYVWDDTSIVADTYEDTLKFVDGYGIDLAGDAQSDAIRVSVNKDEIKDVVGELVVNINTEAGIGVSYGDVQQADGTTEKRLNFDVNDFDITLKGDVTGTVTVTNLGSVEIDTTLAGSAGAVLKVYNVNGTQVFP